MEGGDGVRVRAPSAKLRHAARSTRPAGTAIRQLPEANGWFRFPRLMLQHIRRRSAQPLAETPQ